MKAAEALVPVKEQAVTEKTTLVDTKQKAYDAQVTVCQEAQKATENRKQKWMPQKLL